MSQLNTANSSELTIQQKIALLNKTGSETLEALLSNKTLTAAAEQLGVDRNTVYAHIDKYGLEEIVLALKQKAVTTLAQATVDAAENLANKISSPDEDVSLKASTEILDRAGIIKPQGSSGVNINFNNFAQEFRQRYPIDNATQLS